MVNHGTDDLVKSYVLMLNTIGMSVIIDALKSASYLFADTGKYTEATMDESKKSMAFIQGTGLDIALNYYYIQLDPDQLRSDFKTAMKRKKK